MPGLNDEIKELFRKSALKGNELKAALREIVQENWPGLPPWTTLEAPVIEEVQKATAGSGVVLTYKEYGVQKVVLAETGDHYRKPSDTRLQKPGATELQKPGATELQKPGATELQKPGATELQKPGATGAASFMIPGGFINLSCTPGSSLVPASAAPEDGRTGAAREVEEEFKNPDGSPLLKVSPERLRPMDTKTLLFRSGERRIVMGFMLELTAEEVATVKAHVRKLGEDPAYRAATAQQSMNHESGKPEVSGVSIFTLDDVAGGRCNLMHKDQQSLFEQIRLHFAFYTAKPVLDQPRL